MSKHRVLSLKPQLRLERQRQDGQNETKQPDHSARLGDFFTSSTRIRFSVHTAARRDTTIRLGEHARLKIDRFLVDAGGEMTLRSGPLLFDRPPRNARAAGQIRSLSR
jgi:hypothetical protein